MAIRIRRREFIATLGGAIAAWPLAARAQQPSMPVIGWLSPGSRETDVFRLTAFGRGLSETAHVIGGNVLIDHRWAEGHNDRLPALAADLVRRPANVIAAAGVAAALEAKAASTTIPIVFVVGTDPVVLGLIASLSRPGGNITGVTDLTTELGPKQLELLHELAPSASRIALLVNPTNPNAETLSKDLQAAARTLGLEIHVFPASSERDFDTVFATLAELRIAGLVIGTDALFNSHSQELARLAVQHGLPSIHTLREFAATGGLMSYGGGLRDAYRQLGVYTGRILRGEKPADLPVQQSTKFDLVINLKTAKALGLTVPPMLLATADEVIE
jgi:putative tryptophan/tyrosine transport system substrate-binding protein